MPVNTNNFVVLFSAPRPKINWGELLANREANEARKWEGLPAIIKQFYVEPDSVRQRTDEEVTEFR